MIKTIVFDFNDTLSPTNYVQTFKLYENELGMSADLFVKSYIDSQLLHGLMRGEFNSESEFWEAVSRLTGVNLDLLIKMAQDVALSRCLDTDVMRIVTDLQCRYKLALLTDNSLETFQFWVERFSLKSVFDVILNSAECGILKTDARIYGLLLRDLRMEATEVLLVDDEQVNLEVASSVGLRVLHFVDAEQLEKYMVAEGFLH